MECYAASEENRQVCVHKMKRSQSRGSKKSELKNIMMVVLVLGDRWGQNKWENGINELLTRVLQRFNSGGNRRGVLLFSISYYFEFPQS